jgi:hypothetical protein
MQPAAAPFAHAHHTPALARQLSAFSELQLTETSVVIIATASDFFNEEFDVPSLRDGVSVPTTPAEALDFYRRHGDSYVSQVAFGAEFYAM